MPLSVSVRDIQTLILSYHPVIVIETLEEERVQTLLKQATQEMSIPMFEWSIAQGLIRSPGTFDAPWVNEYAPPGTLKPAAIGNTAEPLAVLKHVQDMTIKALFWLKDFGKHFEDPETARHFREAAQLFSQKRSAFVLTGDNIELPREIEHDAVVYDLKLPDRDELSKTVKDVVRAMRHKHRTVVELQDQDMQALVQAMTGMTLKQARQVLAYAALDDGKLTTGDVERILHRKAQLIRAGGVLDYLPVEDNRVEWGGFANLKQWLARAQVGFSPAAKALNLSPPKGILIVGIQGCGKSLAAKAIAREWKMPLLKLDAGRLYDKYVGESEKNFRKAISLAESMSPTVLWIDEIEKSLGATGSDSDGGLSRRMFGYFLTWMQEKSQEVFVVATANDISQIPPELLRKGRFDEIFYVDLPDLQERGAILRIHLTLRQQDPSHFDLPTLLQATEGYSGAEIEQGVVAALYRSLYLEKPLDTDLLVQEIQAMIPLSVSRQEHLQQLRAIAKDRFMNAR
ncbi:AAA family ATPase [Acaryochloris sp. IP29b_bin.148]|uniref:AAA family ATPase n=1 Tax=Acaryochloris sp. IP29b_bin.148 TaxID=2969218 RepID=UPI0026022D0E|nr:AAA family ATPase [Acaryochloris sp. IP29b_bin.148]